MKTGHLVAFVLILPPAALVASGCGAEHFVPTDGGGGPGGGGGVAANPLGGGGTFTDDAAAPLDVPAERVVDPRKADGLACGAATECRSGFCVDGVCCESACDGICRSCALTGGAGACLLADVGTDPGNDCEKQAVATCGTEGTCDGAGACRRYPEGTTCSVPGCVGSTLTMAGSCRAAGMCQAPAGPTCGTYTCLGEVCRTTCTMTAHCTAPSVCNLNSCGGLVGTYYNSADFTGPVALTRTDATINFRWGAGSPAPGVVDADTFSVRWKGQLTPRVSQMYTFYLTSDDGVRLTVNDTVVIDAFANLDPAAERRGTIALQAGRPVNLQLDYFENQGYAAVRLSWSNPSEPKAIIPTSALAPP